MNFDSVEKVVNELSKGNFVIVFDEYREVEGDFFVLAEAVTVEKVNFLLTHARGMLCVACDKSVINRFEIPLMMGVNNNNEFHTNFCVTIDAANDITTGVSASDRAKTVSILANPNATKSDLVMPGHTFPLLAQDPSERFGHTECAVELAKKTGKTPAVLIGEILNESGDTANKEELFDMAKKWNIAVTNLELVRKSL